MITLRPEAYEAGREYAEALLEACAPFRVDPLKVLLDTADYPKIVKAIEMVEFMVGWFHGLEDCTGFSLREIWGHLSAGLIAGEGKGKEPKQGSKPNTSPKTKRKPESPAPAPQTHALPTASRPPAAAPKPLPASDPPPRTVSPAESIGAGVPKPSPAKPPTKSTRKSRREAAQPRLAL